MGSFFFGLFLLCILFPATAILAIVWRATGKSIWGKMIGMLWGVIALLISVAMVLSIFTSKKELEKEDAYGEYVIDRTQFAGKQADWQYNHFRFEITEQDDFIFYVTEREKVIKAYKGKVVFLPAYNCRIVLDVDTPRHHIIVDNPTLYRKVWSFYYVFNSPKFGNVFFKKGDWKEIEEN